MSIYVYQGSMPRPDPEGSYTIEKTSIPFRSVKSPRLTPQRYVLPTNNLTTPQRQVKPLITLRYRNRPMLPEDQGSPIQIATRRGFNGVGFGAYSSNKQYHHAGGYPAVIWSGQALFRPGVQAYQTGKPGAGTSETCTDCCGTCVAQCEAGGETHDNCRHNCSQGRVGGGCPGCECGHRTLCRGRACGRGFGGFLSGLLGLGDGGSPGPGSGGVKDFLPFGAGVTPWGFITDLLTPSPGANTAAYDQTYPGPSAQTTVVAKHCTPILTNEDPADATKCNMNWPIVGLIGVGLLALLGGGSGSGKVVVIK